MDPEIAHRARRYPMSGAAKLLNLGEGTVDDAKLVLRCTRSSMALSGTASGTIKQIEPRLPKHKRHDISFAHAFNTADDLNRKDRE